MEFKLDEVIANVGGACREFRGTAEQHDYLKWALNTMYEKLKKLEELENSAPKE